MRIKGRTTRTALAGVFAIVAVWGMAPGIAAAEPHARTAPYDFGDRCVLITHYDDPYIGGCGIDPAAIATGVMLGEAGISPQGFIVGVHSYANLGIYFDVGEPGHSSVTLEVDHLAPDTWPFWRRACAYVTNVDTGSIVGWSCGPGRLQITGWASAGKHAVVVETYSQLIVKMITYEVATS